jgi:hypothetical protein
LIGAARRRGALLIALALCSGPAGVASRAEQACGDACPPLLELPEPALRRAVHLAWRDPEHSLARAYEIERRANGAQQAWVAVARLPADRPPHLDDAGADGGGLPPGEYAYRLRALRRTGDGEAWSAWSEARAVVVRDACDGAGGELAGLPRVVASDADGDGRYTGRDLERALRECSARGGCVLEVLPVTYDDVAILLYDGYTPACTPGRTACLTDRFPKGLAIEGHGSSSVLRSPLWRPPQVPMPLLELWRRPELRIQLRHLVLDGRKVEQVGPHPGVDDSNTWWHYGFQTWNQWGDHEQRNRGGCIHDVVVRHFMNRGVSLADVAGWAIEHCEIDGIGCHAELTPCPRLTIPSLLAPGHRVAGHGILLGWYSDDVLARENRIRRVTKYSIGLKHANDASVPSIVRPRIERNEISDAGSLGIFLGGVSEGRFVENRIRSTSDLDRRPEAEINNDTFGISCMGTVDRTVFLRNVLENVAGMAIQWACAGRENVLEANRIRGSCRLKGPRSCLPGGSGRCYRQPDILVGRGAAGDLALVDDEVLDSGCAAPLGVGRPPRAGAAHPDFALSIRGGLYRAGPLASDPVRFQAVDLTVERGARFEETRLHFGRGARGVVTPSVSVRGGRDPFRADAGAQLLVCPEEQGTCRELCEAVDPPAWCEPGDAQSYFRR